MGNDGSLIDRLRAEVDEIDATMHDLVMRRAEVVDRIAGEKAQDQALSAIRPAREAAVLRLLASRHRGAFPLEAVARMWREVIAANLRRQADFTVAVYGGDTPLAYWDLARNHYGAATPMTLFKEPLLVFQEVSEHPAAIGVLPEPAFEESAAWWPLLLSVGEKGPWVIARLPFLRPDARAGRQPTALAVARVAQEPTGDDRTLFAVAVDAEAGRARIIGLFDSAGIPAQCIALAPMTGMTGQRLMLIETQSFVAADDPRLDDIRAASSGAIAQLSAIGGYANPLTLDAAS
jgi:chorismate mutase/prephenate dehydratase